MKTLRLVLLSLALSLAPVKAGPPVLPTDNIPEQILGSPIDMLYYCYGFVQAELEVSANGDRYIWPVRTVAGLARHLAVLAALNGAPSTVSAYFYGRADAFEAEANRRGEP